MAFPTSPTNGQTYKGYVYDNGLWRVDRGEGSLHLFNYSSSNTIYFDVWNPTAAGQRKTYDFSSIFPTDAKAAYICAFIHGSNNGTEPYSNLRVHWANNNTFTPDHPQNTLKCDAIGTMGDDGYVGGNTTGAVRLDVNRIFYGCVEDRLNITAAAVYVSIIGYYS